MLVQGMVAPQTAADGSNPTFRADRSGAQVITPAKGKYHEACFRQGVFWAANQAAQAITVALATTYTGLCISNPLGNTKNIIPIKVGLALSVAPAAIAPIGLITGYSATANVTHTSALTPASALIGTGTGPTAKADSQATITGSPAWTLMLWSGFTAAALPSASPSLIDLDGTLIIPPGGYVAIGALTAVTGIWSMTWLEEPI
jgi:hypothetical protein